MHVAFAAHGDMEVHVFSDPSVLLGRFLIDVLL